MNKRLRAWGLGPAAGPISGQTTGQTRGPAAGPGAPTPPTPQATPTPQVPANDQTASGPSGTAGPATPPAPVHQPAAPIPTAPVAGTHIPPTQAVAQPSAFDHFAQATPTSSSARSFRLSTLISEEHGDLLEDMRHIIRKQTGRRPKIAEIVEAALEALENEMTGGGSS